jgi:hypothetical protein
MSASFNQRIHSHVLSHGIAEGSRLSTVYFPVLENSRAFSKATFIRPDGSPLAPPLGSGDVGPAGVFTPGLAEDWRRC